MRARHRNDERQLNLELEAQEAISREYEERLCANSFTIAAIVAASSPINRERWAFHRNERWFEKTLPHLGEANFRQSFRMTPATFRYLVDSLRGELERQDTNMRLAVAVDKRVAIGLYRLRSTAEDATIAHLFGVGRSTVNVAYREFFAAVIKVLEPRWLRMVRREEMPEHIRKFYAVSGFPQAIGALDGCHIAISPPAEHATDYYNYKGWHSIILLALVDHQYLFKYINVGSPGRCHDAYVYGRSELHNLVASDFFKSPASEIEGTRVGPIILCDQAFPLTPNLLKPFANAVAGTREGIFNYQLSKTRRIVENAFGRLKARFRFTSKRMECKLRTAKQAIRSACVLHNICEALKDPIEQQWEQELHDFNQHYPQPVHSTETVSGEGREVMVALAKYFLKLAH
ncbi:hypothetical protein HPB49_018282 [Dermacentor silvarum]|uniref:Uncharacterized protein n=1 Tax=Dermacentor silvarum TaxID=543639 RepID=A0ACB8CM35_DERSI|nr:hypothetical protein HPB49_018282 [Dermacentor silvarum]